MQATEKKIKPQNPLTKEEQELLKFVDERKQELVELLQDMVRIDSVNVAEDVYAERNEI